MDSEIKSDVTLSVNQIHPEQLKDLQNRFEYHKPFADLPHRYEVVRSTLGGVARLIIQLTPKCREQSLAVTHLEEAMFWANAAIARNTKEPVPTGEPTQAT